MPTTLICTLGVVVKYQEMPYTIEGKDIGSHMLPITALARHYQPERIVLLCPGEAPETAKWFVEEVGSGPVSHVITRSIPNAHSEADLPALLSAVVEAIRENVADDSDIHLDFSLGLRFVSVLALLTTDLLAETAGKRITRVTCINAEAPATEGIAEIIDVSSFLHLGRLRAAVESLERRGDIVFLAEAIADAFPGSLSLKDLVGVREMQRRLALLRTSQATSKSTGRQLVRNIIQTLFEQSSRIPTLSGIAERVRHNLSPLDPGKRHSSSPQAISSFARWYFNHGQQAMAMILIIETANYYAELPLIGEARIIQYRFADFYHTRKKLRHSIAHADVSVSTAGSSLSYDDIEISLGQFEGICAELEAAMPDGSIDKFL